MTTGGPSGPGWVDAATAVNSTVDTSPKAFGQSSANSREGGSTRPRLDTLTAVRGIAAALVFIPHADLVLSGRSGYAAYLFGIPGSRALGLFFALSGFVLTWSKRPGDTTAEFFRRRIARIYPAYLVTIAMAVVVTGPIQRRPLPGGPLLATLFSVQSWVPDPRYYFSYNGVDWTISVEMFMYLVFPLMIPRLIALGRIGRRRLQIAMFVLLLVVGLIGGAGPNWLADRLPVGRLPEFILGCTVALDVAKGELPFRRWGIRGAVALTVAAYAVSILQVPYIHAVPLLTLGTTALLSAIAAADLAGHRSVLNRRVLIWFGEISYSFYLVHQLVVKVVATLLVPHLAMPGQGLPWAVLCFALATLTAWWIHHWVEIPGYRLLRGTSRRTDPVTMLR